MSFFCRLSISLCSYFVALPICQKLYETPHCIDTDVDKILLVWPKVEGRDAVVSIQDDYLVIDVKLAPLRYTTILFIEDFYLSLRKNAQRRLVKANCKGGLATSVSTPKLEQYAT